MFGKKILLALPLVVVGASQIHADARLLPVNPSAPHYRGIEVAQAGIDALSASKMRRLVFYNDRALNALISLDSIQSDATVDAFKDAILRLIDAADRSGISSDAVADFFQLAVQQQFAGNIPAVMLNTNREIDAREVFNNVVAIQNQNNSDTLDPLKGLAAQVGNLSIPLIDTAITQDSSEVLTSSTLPGPEIPAGANAVTRAILERVGVRENGDWFILVIQGDRLYELTGAIYGQAPNFRLLYEANTDVMTSPNTLEVGTVLYLPRKL